MKILIFNSYLKLTAYERLGKLLQYVWPFILLVWTEKPTYSVQIKQKGVACHLSCRCSDIRILCLMRALTFREGDIMKRTPAHTIKTFELYVFSILIKGEYLVQVARKGYLMNSHNLWWKASKVYYRRDYWYVHLEASPTCASVPLV